MNARLKRTPGIYLVGFMGCGKTAVGCKLAEKLGWSFIDVDDDIERAQATSINEIFDTLGEEAFRRMETEAIERRVHAIQAGHAAVVALGGGAFAQPRNFDLIENNGVTVWLDCPLPRILERLKGATNRPLARDPEKFQKLFHARRDSYARADYRVEITSDDANAAVEMLLRLPIF
jgi:shikimate kinase